MPVLLPAEPREQHRGDLIPPRHEHGSARVDDDDRARVRCGHRPHQIALAAGKCKIRAVEALGLDQLVGPGDDDGDVGLARGRRRRDQGVGRGDFRAAARSCLFNAALAAVNATLPDQVPPERRGFASGLVGIGIPLAILAGSLIANVVASDVTRFVAPAALALMLSLLFAIVLEDRVRPTEPAEAFGLSEFFGSFVFNPRRHPDFAWTWLTKFLVMFGYAGIATYLPYFLQSTFGLTESEVISVVVAANVASMGPSLGSAPAPSCPLTSRWPPRCCPTRTRRPRTSACSTSRTPCPSRSPRPSHR